MRPVPTTVTNMDAEFGNSEFAPSRAEIPDEFFNNFTHRKWHDIATQWFFDGLPHGTVFKPKTGVNKNQAIGAVSAVLRTFDLKHEHKKAAAAFLLSEWFEDVVVAK